MLVANMGFMYSIENNAMLLGFVVQNFEMQSKKGFAIF
jgi:hypothetical protein